MDFGNTSASELVEQISDGEITARRAVELSLDAAEKLNEPLNAFLQIDRKGAIARADSTDSQAQHSAAFRSRSKTTSALKDCRRPAVRASSETTNHLTTRRSFERLLERRRDRCWQN